MDNKNTIYNVNGLIIRNNCLERYNGEETCIVIPEGVTYIHTNAFNFCRKVESVKIPETVSTICGSAFSACMSLVSVNIPEKVECISPYTFSSCEKLRNIALHEGIVAIGDWAFCNCNSLENITIPASVQSLGNNVFKDCISLRKVEFKDKIPEMGRGVFEGCTDIVAVLPHGCLMTKEKLPNSLATLQFDADEKEIANIIIYQRLKAWQIWLSERKIKSPEAVLSHMISIMKEYGTDKKSAASVAQFVLKYKDVLSAEKIQQIIALYDGLKCKEITALTEDKIINSKLSGKMEELSSEEKIVTDNLKKYGAEPEAELAVKKGIKLANSDQLCSREMLVFILSTYIRQWNQCSEKIESEMSSVAVLKDGARVQIDLNADLVAAAIDKKSLSEFLEKLVNGTRYRIFMLAWARFADEDSVARIMSAYKKMTRGTAKDRYKAENLKQALLISDTRAAMLFFEGIEELKSYAAIRGMTDTEMRDTLMMPDFGFEDDGIIRYDIGGNIIEVSVTKELDLQLYDINAKKNVRSIPKKSNDAVKAAECAKQFAELKKEVKEFIRTKREQLCRMHVYGAVVKADTWYKIYVGHPIMHRLSQSVVWIDENSKTFVMSDKETVDYNSEKYLPQGDIRIAHVLEMTPEETLKWQKYITDTNGKQLFEQVWEPVIAWDKTNVSERYKDVTITSEQRNQLKTSLKRRGITVHSDNIDRDFNARSWNYEFSDSNTMNLGKSMRIDYRIDSESSDITFKKAKISANEDSREMNAILYEMDKATVVSHIMKDNVQMLTTELLDAFSVVQIATFTEIATENKAVNCIAVLMNYKNEKYPEYDAINDFVMDW